MSKEYSDEVKRLHTEMVKRLSGKIAPDGTLKTAWEELLFVLSNDNPLSQADAERISSMQQLFRSLMSKSFIHYGDYARFEKILRPIHPQMATEVNEYQKKIVAQIEKESKLTRDRRGSDKEGESEGNNQGATENRSGRKRSRQESSNSSRRPVTDDEKQTIHANMVQKLSEELSSDMKKEWKIFMNKMRHRLGFGKAVLTDITDMFDACELLRGKGKISIGEDYDNLIEVVKDVDINLVIIIKEHLKEMGIEPSPERKRRRTRSSEDSL